MFLFHGSLLFCAYSARRYAGRVITEYDFVCPVVIDKGKHPPLQGRKKAVPSFAILANSGVFSIEGDRLG
jgi:hypothetical protein